MSTVVPFTDGLIEKLPRVSPSERVNLPRPASASALLTSVPDRSNITHLNVSDHSASPSPAKSREEAVLRTMRSLEGDKPRVPIFFDDIVNESREAAHQRALRSLEGGNTAQPEMVRKSRTELRRSTGSDRLSTLATVDEVDTSESAITMLMSDTVLPPTTPPRIGPTAPKLDLNLSSRHFLDSPVRQRIVSADAAIALRSSPQSKLRPRDSGPSASPSRLGKSTCHFPLTFSQAVHSTNSYRPQGRQSRPPGRMGTYGRQLCGGLPQGARRGPPRSSYAIPVPSYFRQHDPLRHVPNPAI